MIYLLSSRSLFCDLLDNSRVIVSMLLIFFFFPKRAGRVDNRCYHCLHVNVPLSPPIKVFLAIHTIHNFESQRDRG